MPLKIKRSFIPVILGGNRGAYSLARAFFEAYGIKSVVMSPFLTGAVNHSRIVEHVQVDHLANFSSFMTAMEQLDAAYPTQKKIIFGSDDYYVENLIHWADAFPSEWIIPYAKKSIYESVTDKTNFYQLCETLDIPYPRTVVMDEIEEINSFSYPVIVKPAQTEPYQKLSFAGKRKVYICQDEAMFQEAFQFMRDNHYTGEIIVQEYIPGCDTHLGIVTAYVAKKDRQLKLLSYANVLIDDPTPDAIGNSLVCLTQENPELEESIQKIFAATDFYGFATFDVKYDARTKQYVFFELNARLGSSNYYVTASGNNVARYYVADFIEDRILPKRKAAEEILYSVVPVSLISLFIADEAWKSKVKMLARAGKVFHPLAASFEPHWKRHVYVGLSSLNYCLKLKRHPSLEKQSAIPAMYKERPPHMIPLFQRNQH